MRYINIIFLLLLMCSQEKVKAQTDFTNLQDYNDHIFGGLSNDSILTGILMDQAIEHFGTAYEKYVVKNDSVPDRLQIDDFFILYQNIKRAERISGLIEPMDSIIFPLINDQYSGQPWENGQKIPIVFMNYSVNKISRSALSKGSITFADGQYFDGLNLSGRYDNQELFCLVPFAESFNWENASFILDPKYFLTNLNDNLLYLEIITDLDTIILYPGEEIDMSNYVEGSGIFYVNTHFLSGKEISTQFSLPKSGGIFSYEPNDGFDFFDEVHSFSLYNDDALNYRYGIKFGCGNSDIRKPVFLVSGYGGYSGWELIDWNLIDNGQGWPAGILDLYTKYNIEGLCDELLATGHDVIVVRFEPPNGNVIEQSNYLIGIIQEINDRKFANGSYHESIIIGYSGGAISAKLALDKMEYDYVNGNGPHPHCKLYVSMEGEHQGLNLPLGAQLGLKKLYDEQGGVDGFFSLGGMKLNVLYSQLHAPMTKQLVTYYYTETGKVGETPPGQGYHPDRQALLDYFDSFGHAKQIEKYGYTGYPAFSRCVAVVDGANSVSGSNVPFDFAAGHLIYQHDAPFSNWYIYNTDNQRILDPNPALSLPKTVFQYTKLNVFGGFQYADIYQTNNEIFVLDNTLGGFLINNEDALSTLFNVIFPAKLFNAPTVNNYITSTATWTISTLDIRNYDPTTDGYQARYDTKANWLMFTTFDYLITEPSNSFGYPSLAHPFTHFSWTPFEGIYCDELNKTHISSLNFDTDGDLVGDNLGTIKNYIIYEEVEPYVMHLQNLKIGWNANSSDIYYVDYEAQTAIIIGRMVTPKTDIAPVIIQSNAVVTFKSEEAVIIQAGFSSELGATYHIYIAPLNYSTDCLPANSGMAPITTDDNNLPEDDQVPNLNESEHNNDVVIYPNPTSQDFTVVLADGEQSPFYLQIFDLSGKIVFSGIFNSNEQIAPSLDSGIYLLYIEYNNHTATEKLIINP